MNAGLPGIHVSARRGGVIQSFADSATEALFHGQRGGKLKRLPADVRRVGLRKLDLLNGAHQLEDLRSPPGNRLESLKGDLRGFHSIRVNDQWRIVFRWTDAGPADVSLSDYH